VAFAGQQYELESAAVKAASPLEELQVHAPVVLFYVNPLLQLQTLPVVVASGGVRVDGQLAANIQLNG